MKKVIKFFRFIKREKKLYREILAFSVLYNYRIIKIYSHYPIINGKKITFYYYFIKTFDFTSEDSKKKWTAYKFIKNIYDI